MILFRTSNYKRRNSLAFLKTHEQQTALLAHLEKQSWVDEIFSRQLPIPAQFTSRFGPPEYSRNVFYSSEKRETTFFEYSYAILKSSSVTGLGINAVCFDIKFTGRQKPTDASQAKNLKSILDLNDYRAAHQWLLSLNPMPESVRYPSVREPAGGGINFAIYERSAVTATAADVEDFVFTSQGDGSVIVQSLHSNGQWKIVPIR